MDKDIAIKVENLGKKFTQSLTRSMAYGSIDLSKNFLGLKAKSEVLRKGEFWALEDVNFELKKGESLGIIGSNGSGKSTLLRMLTGIFPPDKGTISTRGRVGALIAVGAGFHPHMTGRENVYLNGTLLGMSRKEISEKFDEIIDFAEVGGFIDAPVATYSSGMRVRLGFAIAVKIRPDILLVDEVLSVGDQSFRFKARKEMDKLLSSGVTLIFISHNLHEVIGITDRAIWLDKGKVVADGPSVDVCSEYLKSSLPDFLIDADFDFVDKSINKLLAKNTKVTNGKFELADRLFEYDADKSDTSKVTIEFDMEAQDNFSEQAYFAAQLTSITEDNVGYRAFAGRIDLKKGELKPMKFVLDVAGLHIGKYMLRFEVGTEGGPMLIGIKNLAYIDIINPFQAADSNPARSRMLSANRGAVILPVELETK